MYSKKLLLCKSIPIGLGLIAGAFTFYYFLPFYLSGIHTRAVVVSRRDLCTEFAYTDLSGLSHRLCKKLDEKDIGSDDQLDIWYLYDSPEETLEISPGAILLGSSTGVIFVVFCVFASLWWTWWRLNRWAEFERVKLELIDLALPWSNPFGLGSICSRSMKTYRVLVSDRFGVKYEGWVKYGKFWYASLEREVIWKDKIPGVESLDDILEARRQARDGSLRPTKGRPSDNLYPPTRMSERDFHISDFTLNWLYLAPGGILIFMMVGATVLMPLNSRVNQEALFQKLEPRIVEMMQGNPRLPLVFSSSKCDPSLGFENRLKDRNIPYIRFDVTYDANPNTPRNHVYVSNTGSELTISTTSLKKARIAHSEVGRNWLGLSTSDGTPITVIGKKIIRKSDIDAVVKELS